MMKDIIRKIVHKYGTRNPFELADCLGAVTITTSLPEGTRGYYTYYRRNGIICIDDNLSEEESRIVCAHELGHFILHRTENTVLMKNTTFINTNKFEIQANRFAAHLLISDQDLIEFQEYNYSFSQMSAILHVPESILGLRIEKC